jgi:hypothetical protein
MAYESVAITAGSGTNIAVDAISGQNFQSVKLDVGADGVASGPVCLANPLPIASVAATGGGAAAFHLVLAGGVNATRIKATPGKVFSIDVTNNSANLFVVRFHDSAAATPVTGISAVIAWSFGVQAGVPRSFCFGDLGLAFATGIGISVVRSVVDTDTTAVAANDGIVNISWI